MKNKGSATEFLRAFGFQGQYNGKSVTRKLSGGRIARISVSEYGGRGLPTSGTFISLKVEIVNIKEGPIDSALFVFDDHLDRSRRTDNRGDFPGRSDSRTYMVLDHCGWGWYIAVPKDTKPLVKAVEDYIGLFEE